MQHFVGVVEYSQFCWNCFARAIQALCVCSEDLFGIAGHGTSKVRLLHIRINIQPAEIIRYQQSQMYW